MNYRSFTGITVTALSIAISLAVVAYWIIIVWWIAPLEVPIDAQHIPPAAYALVLFAAWSAIQRAQAHSRPLGRGWWWADIGPSVGLVLFMGATLGMAIYKGFDQLTLVNAGAFFGGSVFDLFYNGRHWTDGGRAMSVDGNDMVQAALSGEDVRIDGARVILENPTVHLRRPDGSLMQLSRPGTPALGPA